jgi:2-dehydro-3-deoxyphosphogluconate aldolase / (4S)-4-hydroxy-2-oxoglutarate aldolase
MTKMEKSIGGSLPFLVLARQIRIIPVITVERTEDAVALARALVKGGLPLIEITLRTQSAIDAIRGIAESVPEAHVGAGTVREPGQGKAAIAAGARFIVSPGATTTLLDAALEWGVPFLPGVATASEIMGLTERGITFMKLFPAEPSGGIPLLKALAAPFQDVAFCPTGGIDQDNAGAYLALTNVACVGGSWMVPQAALTAHDWPRITELATRARRAAPSGAVAAPPVRP